MTYLRAWVGDRWMSVLADPPDVLSAPLPENPLIVEFLEGLRVGSPHDVETIGEACWQCAVFGKQGDPFADASPNGTDAPQTDGEPTVTSERPVEAPSDADPDTGRPLTELATGDVVVPTYIPPGLTLNNAKIVNEPRIVRVLVPPGAGRPPTIALITVTLYQSGGPPWAPSTAVPERSRTIHQSTSQASPGGGTTSVGPRRLHRTVRSLVGFERSRRSGIRTVHRGVASCSRRTVPRTDLTRQRRLTVGHPPGRSRRR